MFILSKSQDPPVCSSYYEQSHARHEINPFDLQFPFYLFGIFLAANTVAIATPPPAAKATPAPIAMPTTPKVDKVPAL